MAASGNVRYSQIRSGDRSGTGAKVATVTGTLTQSKQLEFDANGNVVASSFATGGGGIGGGALILLEQQTASSSASLDFTSSISSTYDSYLIDLTDIVPATDAVKIGLRVSTNGGSSYVATASYKWIATATSASAIGFNGSNSDTVIYFNNILSNSTTEGSFNAKIWMKNPANSTAHKSFHGQSAGFNTVDYIQWAFAGWYASATAINAFQILASSGNIASGTVRCYGITKV